MSDLRKIRLLLQLRRNVWRKTEDLIKIQQKKLKTIVKHAYENVEFYHRKFDLSGLKPSDIMTVEDLKKLPITTKQEIRDNYPNSIVTQGIDLKKCAVYRTSGSTGIPLTVALDERANDYRAALFGRPFFECGLGLRDKMLVVGDARHFPKSTTWYQKFGLIKRAHVPAASSVEKNILAITKYNPDAIYAYSSYILLLANAIKNLGARQINPKLIFGTAEIMTKKMRKTVQSVFNTDIYDLYGCVETERLAWECDEHAGYHMDIDSTIMEFLKDGEDASAGEPGQIVLTCLYNKTMPLIRYALGDFGTPTAEKCPCGRGLPLLKNIVGRTDDLIQRFDGKIVVPANFSNLMREIQGIFQFKVIQENEKLIVVYIVKEKGFSRVTIRRVIDGIKRIVGMDIAVKTVIVDEIAKDDSGKIRSVVSKVHS